MSNWIKLAKICQNQGIIATPDYVITALTRAFKLPVDVKIQEEKPVKDWFIDRCLFYYKDKIVEKIMDGLRKDNPINYKPVWHYLTVDEIEINMENFPSIEVRLDPENLPSVKWRWTYWYPAFSWFWAFIYHTENEFLRRPKLIIDEINKHTNTLVDLERKSDETSTAYPRFYLALYERVLALLYDIKTNHPHYVKNITHRKGLTPQEIEERPELFQEAVIFLKKRLEEEISIGITQ